MRDHPSAARLPLPAFEPGSVWLVGAGPGDPGLLTALALHALTAADVVLHDALVADEVLALANPRARLVDAGKRGGGRRMSQSVINGRLLAEAKAGRRVLRLKGGDPLVFGRGAEEAQALAAANIPYRIVPGITAGIGGLAYAGIAPTERAVNDAVTFVTAQGRDGGSPDWRVLVGSPLLVIYMGLARLPEIAVQLIAAGLPADTPLAIVSAATTVRQQVIDSTLGAASLDARRRGAAAPALIVVGAAARRRSVGDWFTPATLRLAVPQPALQSVKT